MADLNGTGYFVALTGNATVGFGSSQDEILGRIITVEEAGSTDIYELAFDGQEKSATFMLDDDTVVALGGTTGESYVASVEWGRLIEVELTTTTGFTFGKKLAADGDGGLEVLSGTSAVTPNNVTCINVDSTNNIINIKLD